MLEFQSQSLKISIPAPARGRTLGTSRIIPDNNFNSRPREGANLTAKRQKFNPDHFNSRPREGANAVLELCQFGGAISIPAPARGRTAKLHKIEQSILSVC